MISLNDITLFPEKFIDFPVAALDLGCSKVDRVYRKYPFLLKSQAVISLFIALGLFAGSKLGKYLFHKAPLFILCVILPVILVYYTILIIFLARAKRQPLELQSRMPQYLRPIIQWVIVEVLKNVGEGAKTLSDWPATLGFFFLIHHVITVVKLTKKMNDFGALDGFISITMSFTEEAVQNPWIKTIFTICFAILMAMREHRAKLKRNKTDPSLATITWILNNRNGTSLTYHRNPIPLDCASSPQLLLPSPPAPPHEVAAPPIIALPLGIPVSD